MESNTASLKRKKHQQRQDDFNDIISNMHILSNQFWVTVLPYRPRRKLKIAEKYSNPGAKVQRFSAG